MEEDLLVIDVDEGRKLKLDVEPADASGVLMLCQDYAMDRSRDREAYKCCRASVAGADCECAVPA